MKTMAYKDYVGSAEVSVEDGVLHGKLLGIRDLVSYEADTPAALRTAFEEAVEDYLADCAEEGRAPDIPFKPQDHARLKDSIERLERIGDLRIDVPGIVGGRRAGPTKRRKSAE